MTDAEKLELFAYIQEHEASDGIIAKRLLWANEAEKVLRDTLSWFQAYEPCSPQGGKIKSVLKGIATAKSHSATGSRCCWCSVRLPLAGDCYSSCPHCHGSFSFRKPFDAPQSPEETVYSAPAEGK